MGINFAEVIDELVLNKNSGTFLGTQLLEDNKGMGDLLAVVNDK